MISILEILRALLGGSIASMAYAMVFDLRGKTLAWAAFGGGLSWACYLITCSILPDAHEIFPYFFASLIISIYAEVLSRIKRKPTTVFLLVAILPLVPGFGIYHTMMALVEGDTNAFLIRGTETLSIAGALAFGMLFVSSVTRYISDRKRRAWAAEITAKAAAKEAAENAAKDDK